VLANGTVQVNVHSPAYFLNQNFYGDVNVPAYATATAAPVWKVVDRTGELEWHDHRIHWMSPVIPPEVKNKDKRTKIFDWTVPLSVGTQQTSVDGQLYWVPEEDTKTPLAAIVGLVVVSLAGIAFVLIVRRRRRYSPGPGAPGSGGVTPGEDAW
jgi:LPXTG-motif cell wall-anchored protein